MNVNSSRVSTMVIAFSYDLITISDPVNSYLLF